MPKVISPQVRAYERRVGSRRWLWRVIAILAAGVGLVTGLQQVPALLERYQRKAAGASVYKTQLAIEHWSVDHAFEPKLALDRYPPDFNQVLADGYALEQSVNPYSGSARKCVAMRAPSPGDFSYLPLRGRATLYDGRVIDDTMGYLLILWARKELATDLVIGNSEWRAPVAMTLENGLSQFRGGMNQEFYPKDVEVQTFEEALARYGLERLSKPPSR